MTDLWKHVVVERQCSIYHEWNQTGWTKFSYAISTKQITVVLDKPVQYPASNCGSNSGIKTSSEILKGHLKFEWW